MYIKDLQARQGNVELEAEVKEVGEVREFDKFGKKGRVASAMLSDGTGTVKLSLWNEQIEQVAVGAKVKITKGYVSEWQGELQLTTGKFGTLEVLDSDAPAAAPEEKPITEPHVDPEEVLTDDEKKEADLLDHEESSTAEQSSLDIEEEKL